MIDLIGSFAPITLEQMSGVKLMNRTDTKFVTTLERLRLLLQMAQGDYYIQEIDGERNMEYDTTYFDTTAFDMYRQHQYGHTNRQKIRFRTYATGNSASLSCWARDVRSPFELRGGARHALESW